MLWRVLGGIGGLTFIWTGGSILLDDSCQWVTWGRQGSARYGTFVATCWQTSVEGAWTGSAAGIVSIAGGLALIAIVAWPLIRAMAEEAKYR
jgi:hypothetical protein